MTNKIALITGASSGLGEQLAQRLAEKNYNLILIARNGEKLKQLQIILEDQYAITVNYYSMDLSQLEQLKQFVTTLPVIDLFICNAGYGIFEPIEEVNIAQAEHMFAVNVLAPIILTQAILPKMYDHHEGHIIYIASQASKIATPKTSVYSATKFALRGFANAVRLEAKPYNVKITTVNPGPIQTNFFNIADQTNTYLNNVKRHILQPEQVVNKIIKAIEHPIREINLPNSMHIASKFYTLFPNLSDYLTIKFFNRK